MSPDKADTATVLKKPERPTRQANDTGYSDKLDEYKFDYRLYEESVKGIATVERHIMNTVTRTLFAQVTDCQTVQERLRVLKRRLTPTDLVRENDVISRYQALKKPTQNENLNIWLDKWMKVVADCQKLSLSEGTTSRTVTDFLNTLDDVHPSFTDRWRSEQRKGTHMTFLEVANEFRDLHTDTISTSNLSTFNATWQGKPADSPKEDTGGGGGGGDRGQRGFNPTTMSCICGSKHRFEDCPYMVEAKRPRGWKPNEEVVENFRKRMTKSIGVRRRIGKLQENEKNPLNLGENSRKDSDS